MVTDYSEHLRTGKENAISSQALAEAMGFTCVRTLQEDIARSRAAGQVICSSTTGGYYLPADREEIREFIHALESRAKCTFLALRSARQAVACPEWQLSIFDFLEEEEVNEG